MQWHYFLYDEGRNEVYNGLDGEDAQAWAKRQMRAPKHHKEKWLTYLRVLDARAAGASLAEMAEILPEHMGRRDPQTARNVLTQAQQQASRF